MLLDRIVLSDNQIALLQLLQSRLIYLELDARLGSVRVFRFCSHRVYLMLCLTMKALIKIKRLAFQSVAGSTLDDADFFPIRLLAKLLHDSVVL